MSYCLFGKPWLVVIELAYEASFATLLGIIAAFVYEKIQIDRKKREFEENTKHIYGKYQVFKWPDSGNGNKEFKLNKDLSIEISRADRLSNILIKQDGTDKENHPLICELQADVTTYKFGSGIYKHTKSKKKDVGEMLLYFVEKDLINVDKSYSENDGGIYNTKYEKWQWRKEADNN